MRLSPDNLEFWRIGEISINATLMVSWAVMALLLLAGRVATWHLTHTYRPGHFQAALEIVISVIARQIDEIAPGRGRRYLPFIATLFLYILACNLIALVPGVPAPTGSLSTTTALALAVLLAVPAFSIAEAGLGAYLRAYARPSLLMIPFTLIGEVSRTLALAMRLYGNVMSGAVLAAILISVAPLFFPVLMQGFSLLTGFIQAYIFAVLAAVYIAAASPSSSTHTETQHG